MTNIDNLIKTIASKLIEKQDASFFTKLSIVIFVFLGVWYLQYKLNQSNAELAKLRIEADWKLIEAQKARLQSELTTYETIAKEATAKAVKLQNEATATLSEINNAVELHALRVKQLNSITNNDWNALNKIAGIQP